MGSVLFPHCRNWEKGFIFALKSSCFFIFVSMVWVFFPLCDFLNSFRSSVKGRLQPDVHVWFVLSPSLLATALKLLDSPESCRSALFLIRGVTALQDLAVSRFPALLPGGGPCPLNELLSRWRNSPMELLAPQLRFLLIVISLLFFGS